MFGGGFQQQSFVLPDLKLGSVWKGEAEGIRGIEGAEGGVSTN